MTLWRCRGIVGVIWFLAVWAPACWALAPDQIVLLVNKNVPAGQELANFYARERHVPADRVLALDIPTGTGPDEMPAADFDRAVTPAVRQFLKERGLASKVTCLVTFYGIPLRVAARPGSPERAQELSAVDAQGKTVLDSTLEAVAAAEKLAAEVDAKFKPGSGDDAARLAARVETALGTDLVRLMLANPDAERRADWLARWGTLVEKMLGPQQAGEYLVKPELGAKVTRDRLTELRKESNEGKQRLVELRSKIGVDAAARAEARQIVARQFGLLRLLALLQSQHELLNDAETVAAFDSELSMVWWESYPRHRWQTNWLNYKVIGQAPKGAPPVLMVMRIDGPTPGIARDLISAAIKAETFGLTGRVVLDGRGMKGNDGYAQYDWTIRRLAELLRSKTKLDVTFDDQEPVIQPPRTRDVALYCGWYSVRNYVPAFIFKPGAVGFHVASFELLTLRDPKEKGWVRNLLQAGVASTLGPVDEPYLQAFPPADDFFPLLLTGKLTLAEVYWRTTPMTSWMISCIGDPLYNPYKANPPLAAPDLPDRLKPALAPVAAGGAIPK